MDEEVVNWDDYIQVASGSDVGMRRSNNQDNLSISIASSLDQWRRNGHLFVVADGMGAHAAGELASQLAADNLSHLFVRNSSDPIDICFRKSIEQTNLEIHRRGQANPDFYNMGTTCSSLAISTAGGVIGHVGDSRVYRMRGSRLEQLTFDHSLVWELKASGQIQDENESSVPKNVITRSLGPYAEVKVDVEGPFRLEPGDTFLLCSDGLTGVVQDDEIGPVLAGLEPEEAQEFLINLANLRGGPDNITVIIVRVLRRPPAKGESVSGSTDEGGSLGMLLSWLLFGVLVVSSVLLGLWQGSVLAAAVPGVAAIVSLAIAIVMTSKQMAQTGGGTIKGAFGKAPYTQTSATANGELSKRLFHVVREVLETAKKEKWQLQWTEIDQRLTAIKAFESENQFSESVPAYCRLINSIMQQVRKRSG